MNRSNFSRRVATAALGLAALVAMGAAQARTDVFLSLGLPGPVYAQQQPVYVQPQPVYVQPQPVYVQPQPVYVQPRPVYVQPQPVYMQPQPVYGYSRGGAWGDRDRDGIPNAYDRWDNRQNWHHGGHRGGPRGDADRDGVPNRFDRAPANPGRH
jgi:hypothetical protein